MTEKRFIFITVILVLLQIIANISLSVSPYVFIAPVCFLLLGLDRGCAPVKCMIIAFLSGLLVDVMSSGIPGLWSASLTAAAVPRLMIVRRRVWKMEGDRYDMPSPREMGIGVYLLYALSVDVVFYAVYAVVEKMSFVLTGADGVRILISVAVNTLCLLVIALLVQDNRRY